MAIHRTYCRYIKEVSRVKKRFLWLGAILMLSLLGACRRENIVTLPTPITADTAATHIFLTREAPPKGFDTVSFASLDANLNTLDGWRYEMSFEFEGVFARTTRLTSATTTAQVQANNLFSARRVTASIDNDLQAETAPTQLEAVKLGEDAFLLRDGVCNTPASDTPSNEARLASELGVGVLLGGLSSAPVAYKRATLNSEAVWLYTVTSDALVLPNVGKTAESVITLTSGELWVSPSRNVVVRFYATLDVQNVTIFGGTLPVTGILQLRYDLYDVGILPNIGVPFGC
jgi:hypothetical protein